MKLPIEPYDEGDSDTEDKTQSNGVAQTDEPTKKSVPLLRCEVVEYEARPNLKGEQVLKLVVAQDDSKKEPSEDDDSQKYCMRSEKWFAQGGGLELQSLIIYSPHIQDALRAVIRTYSGVNLRASPIILEGTLQCVFHYRNELAKHRDALKDTVAKLHVSLLLRFMQKELRQVIRFYAANVESVPQHPAIDFTNVWTIFKPGQLVVTGKDEKLQIAILERTWLSGGTDPRWSIVGSILDHDGRSYGWVEKSYRISSFSGVRLISKLPIYPLSYHEDEEAIYARLVTRGKKFCSLVGCHYRSYSGIAQALSHKRDVGSYGQLDDYALETTMIKGRIMVDCNMFAVFKAPNRIELDEIRPSSLDFEDQSEGFSDREFAICSSRVLGFSLTSKRWCIFSLDLVEEVDLNKDAFRQLLLPAEQKKLVYALVKTHSEDSGAFDDLIKGKGKGLIFVLHGEPGVGKTFTAESVADHLGRPLYNLHSGELGVTPESVETNLNNALMLASTWKAVLLIDEADVFMEQRTVQDLTRNCLVSLFLRTLEYYEGILFLTTNRIDTFDLAFKSRVHLALKYNALNTAQRRELWQTFISRTRTAQGRTWSDEDLDVLAAPTLNGRQIKNAVRTADSLAYADGASLDQTYLNIVLQTLEAFEQHLNENTQHPGCASPKILRRQSTMMSRLSLMDKPMTEEPDTMK